MYLSSASRLSGGSHTETGNAEQKEGTSRFTALVSQRIAGQMLV